METSQKKTSIWSIGLSMFAMFFGAGNIVFPLALGQMTQDQNLFAIFGMMITAILVPLAGLLSMMLFEGNYNSFFQRIGKIPGSILIILILILIGPFAGSPRCVTISFSTLSALGIGQIPGVSLLTFSLLSCLLIYLFTFKPNKILTLLGYVLTPMLLLSLATIVVKGLLSLPERAHVIDGHWQPFSIGFLGGYNTMDLLASFFFSSVVLVCLKKRFEGDKQLTLKENKRLLLVAVFGSFIAAALLATIYVSFSYLSAGYSQSLQNIPESQILGTLTYQLLGPYAGMIAGLSVSLACLTTEIALTVVFAQFLQKNIFKDKISYHTALIVTLAITFCVSTLRFEGISAFVAPILQMCYPALILLAILNLLYKLYGFKPVRIPVYCAFVAGVICYIAY